MIPISVCVSPPVLSWVADVFNIHGHLAFASGLIAGILAPLLLVVTSGAGSYSTTEGASLPAPFFVLLMVALSSAPIPPMLDTAVLKILPDTSRYGELRIWGAIGFGSFAFATGFVIDSFGVGSNFYIYSAGIALAGISLSAAIFRHRAQQQQQQQYLHSEESDEEEMSGMGQQKGRNGSDTFIALRGMLMRPGAKQFFAVAFIYGVSHSVVNNVVPMFLTKDLDASGSIVGLALVMALCGEVPCFLASQRILTMFKEGPYSVLTLAHATMACRMVAYALAGWLRTSTLALAVQLLHGLTFSLPWAAFVLITNSIAPPGFGATIQSVLHALFVGVAGSTGAFMGSFFYSVLGSSKFFLCVAAAVSASYFFVLSKMPHNYSPQIISTTSSDFDS